MVYLVKTGFVLKTAEFKTQNQFVFEVEEKKKQPNLTADKIVVDKIFSTILGPKMKNSKEYCGRNSTQQFQLNITATSTCTKHTVMSHA